ncbi:MAG: helix-turn-helix transcriptional regulator [Sphingomonas sp.]
MSTVHFAGLSTELIPESQRLDYWFSTTGGRMACSRSSDTDPIHARVAVLAAPEIEFMSYESRGFMMERTARMCAADDRDEISIGLVSSPVSGAVQHDREIQLRRGQLYVIDFGHAVRSVLPAHQELALFLPRSAVRSVIGDAVDALGGHMLQTSGIGGLLAAHMQALAVEAPLLSATEREVAMRAASELALATLSAAPAADAERFANGLYAAAIRLIDLHCGDHEFSAAALAAHLGCSRATLYRLFARYEEGVAEAIWTARLERARGLLLRDASISVTEAAYRSGFLDLSSFARMYRRRFGHSPRELRDIERAGQAKPPRKS